MATHERDPQQRLDVYLCRVLIALVKQNNGEVRVKESTIEAETRQLLLRDYDVETGELIFHVGSRYAEPIWVEPVQSAWTIPFEDRARQINVENRGVVHTDEQLAEMERQQNLRRSVRAVAPPVTKVPSR